MDGAIWLNQKLIHVLLVNGIIADGMMRWMRRCGWIKITLISCWGCGQWCDAAKSNSILSLSHVRGTTQDAMVHIQIFLNCDRFTHYCSCPTVRDWIAVHPALREVFFHILFYGRLGVVRVITSQWGFTRPLSIYFSLGLVRDTSQVMLYVFRCNWACIFCRIFWRIGMNHVYL